MSRCLEGESNDVQGHSDCGVGNGNRTGPKLHTARSMEALRVNPELHLSAQCLKWLSIQWNGAAISDTDTVLVNHHTNFWTDRIEM
jgi:hypothetical protein